MLRRNLRGLFHFKSLSTESFREANMKINMVFDNWAPLIPPEKNQQDGNCKSIGHGEAQQVSRYRLVIVAAAVLFARSNQH